VYQRGDNPYMVEMPHLGIAVEKTIRIRGDVKGVGK
jgi:hypothetical protein